MTTTDAALAGEITEIVSCSEEPLHDALAVIRSRLFVDRVSLSTVDERAGTFRMLASSGAALLVPGTELPLELSSYFDSVAGGAVFDAPDFSRVGGFTRPLDQVVATAGFRSGAALPLRRGTSIVGALALSGRTAEALAGRLPGQLVATAAVLATTLRDVTTDGKVCLVLADDPLTAEGLARLVERAVSARPVICRTVNAAVAAVATAPPALILTDDHIDGARCDLVIGRLRRGGSAAPIVVVASHDTPQNVISALDAGAAGYLPRASAVGSLAVTVRAVLAGRTVLPIPDGTEAAERLTPREVEVLAALADGLAVRQVARKLGISEPTAKSHTRNLLRKLDAHSRIEALTAARRQGYL